MTILIITKNYPPAICGVGDHTANLVREFERKGISTWVFTETKESAGENIIVSKEAFGSSIFSQLNEVIQQRGVSHILWQYVPYSYHKKGLPFWWPELINRFHRPGLAQSIFFHEVSLRVWGYGIKQFAVAVSQRFIANLASLSAKTIFTSIPLYAGYFLAKNPVIVPISANITLAQIRDSGGGAGGEAVPKVTDIIEYPAPEEQDNNTAIGSSQIPSTTNRQQATGNRQPAVDIPPGRSIFCFANRADKALIKAFVSLRRVHDIHLVLGGSVSEEKKAVLDIWISEAGVNAFTSITGAVDNASLAALINQATIYIQPQIVERKGQGGISAKNGTIMAAMSMGKAIITCKGDMTDPEIFRDEYNLLFVGFGDAEGYLGAMERLLAGSEIRQRLGLKAWETYNRFCSWPTTSGLILHAAGIL